MSLIYQNKTTKIGFEDIGELATQAAYCTEVCSIDEFRQVFGVNVPFTESKYIYSYDVIIKAGLNFSDIDWKIEEAMLTIKLPKMKILSSEVDLDSFKSYHESESIYNQIRLDDTNEALKKLKQNAETNAIANGLLESARSNAELILKGFFGKVYDLETYKIVFKEK